MCCVGAGQIVEMIQNQGCVSVLANMLPKLKSIQAKMKQETPYDNI